MCHSGPKSIRPFLFPEKTSLSGGAAPMLAPGRFGHHYSRSIATMLVVENQVQLIATNSASEHRQSSKWVAISRRALGVKTHTRSTQDCLLHVKIVGE